MERRTAFRFNSTATAGDAVEGAIGGAPAGGGNGENLIVCARFGVGALGFRAVETGSRIAASFEFVRGRRKFGKSRVIETGVERSGTSRGAARDARDSRASARGVVAIFEAWETQSCGRRRQQSVGQELRERLVYEDERVQQQRGEKRCS